MTQAEFETILFGTWHPKEEVTRENWDIYSQIPLDEKIEKLLIACRSDADGIVLRAAYHLLKIDRDRFVPVVVDLLSSPSVGIRWVVCNVFGAIPCPEARETLENLAVHDPDNIVRGMAIEALAECGNEKTIALLGAMAQTCVEDNGRGIPLAELAARSQAKLKSGPSKDGH